MMCAPLGALNEVSLRLLGVKLGRHDRAGSNVEDEVGHVYAVGHREAERLEPLRRQPSRT